MNYLMRFINYLQATKNLSAKTLKAYKSDLTQFFNFEKDVLNPDKSISAASRIYSRFAKAESSAGCI